MMELTPELEKEIDWVINQLQTRLRIHLKTKGLDTHNLTRDVIQQAGKGEWQSLVSQFAMDIDKAIPSLAFITSLRFERNKRDTK